MPGLPIDLTAVSVSYRTREGPLPVLTDVSLSIPAGSRVAVMGPSGAGKTTLLALLGGLEPIQTGSIRVGDTELATLRGDQLARYRHETVGFVFQHFGLLGNLTALENVELAMSFTRGSKRERNERARTLLTAVGVGHRAGHRPGELSGGEAQRVALARALANEPRVLLADEPTGNLDGDSAAKVLDLLDAIADARGITLVTVTHDPRVAGRAERTVTLRDGRVASSDLGRS